MRTLASSLALRTLAALIVFLFFGGTAPRSAASVGQCATSCYYGNCWGPIDEGKWCMETHSRLRSGDHYGLPLMRRRAWPEQSRTIAGFRRIP